jgi:hypothetical protein
MCPCPCTRWMGNHAVHVRVRRLSRPSSPRARASSLTYGTHGDEPSQRTEGLTARAHLLRLYGWLYYACTIRTPFGPKLLPRHGPNTPSSRLPSPPLGREFVMFGDALGRCRNYYHRPPEAAESPVAVRRADHLTAIHFSETTVGAAAEFPSSSAAPPKTISSTCYRTAFVSSASILRRLYW